MSRQLEQLRILLAKEAGRGQAGLETYIERVGEAFSAMGKDHLMNWLIPKLVFADYENKEIVLRYPLEERFSNPTGIVLHGGMSAVFFDTAMGTFVAYYAMNQADTVNLHVDYLRPVMVGQDLNIRVKIHKHGKNLSFVSAESFQDTDPEKILATANATFFIYS